MNGWIEINTKNDLKVSIYNTWKHFEGLIKA